MNQLLVFIAANVLHKNMNIKYIYKNKSKKNHIFFSFFFIYHHLVDPEPIALLVLGSSSSSIPLRSFSPSVKKSTTSVQREILSSKASNSYKRK